MTCLYLPTASELEVAMPEARQKTHEPRHRIVTTHRPADAQLLLSKLSLRTSQARRCKPSSWRHVKGELEVFRILTCHATVELPKVPTSGRSVASQRFPLPLSVPVLMKEPSLFSLLTVLLRRYPVQRCERDAIPALRNRQIHTSSRCWLKQLLLHPNEQRADTMLAFCVGKRSHTDRQQTLQDLPFSAADLQAASHAVLFQRFEDESLVNAQTWLTPKSKHKHTPCVGETMAARTTASRREITAQIQLQSKQAEILGTDVDSKLRSLRNTAVLRGYTVALLKDARLHTTR